MGNSYCFLFIYMLHLYIAHFHDNSILGPCLAVLISRPEERTQIIPSLCKSCVIVYETTFAKVAAVLEIAIAFSQQALEH